VGVRRHPSNDLRVPKPGGMDVGEAQRLRSVEDENSCLKRRVPDLSLDKEMPRAVTAKDGLSS
jgi:hypothetical protein